MSSKVRSTDEDIEVMKTEVARLAGFLNDPEPGLSTWMVAVGESLHRLNRIREGIPDPDPKAELTQKELVETLRTKLSPNEMYHLFSAVDEDGDMSFYAALGEEAKKARPEEFISEEGEQSES